MKKSLKHKLIKTKHYNDHLHNYISGSITQLFLLNKTVTLSLNVKIL